ncbi:MAG: hypothetical protein ACUVX8_11860 [Candidatus Zipacnadales bacterium]
MALKIALYTLAACVAIIGLIFLIGNQGLVSRLIVGIVLIGSSIALLILTRMKVPQPAIHITQDIEIPGDSELEQLKCQNCGAPVDKKSIELREGAIFVKCPYCGTAYQVEEAPQW